MGLIPRTHADACNLIRLAVSGLGGLVLEYKTGALRDEHGRLVRFGKPGASDLLACIDGTFYAIEVKLGRDTWKPEQRSFAEAVRRAGGVHVLARFTDREDGVAALLAACGRPAPAPPVAETPSC